MYRKNWTFLTLFVVPLITLASTSSLQALTASPPLTLPPQKTENICVELYNQDAFSNAVKFCLQSAQEGNIDSQYLLGKLYQEGKGTSPDYAKAIHWYQQAAQKNHPEALFELGKAYSTGTLPIDYQKAFQYFSKAAQQDIVNAQLLLALCYQIGHGTPQNYERATHWLNIAQANGMSVPLEITLHTKDHKTTNQNHTTWAAQDLYLKAMHLVDSKNTEKRNHHLHWLQEAAAQGNPKAQYQLALYYFQGTYLPQNNAKAFEWFSKAAASSYPPAQSLLAWMHALGLGIHEDIVQATVWFEKALINKDSLTQKLVSVQSKILSETD